MTGERGAGMALEAGAPDTPVMAAGSSGSAVPLDTLSYWNQSFPGWKWHAGVWGVKKCPLPPPSSGEDSEPDSGPAVAGGSCLDGSDDASPDLSDSEEESSSSVAAQKALVEALMAVRDTLKNGGYGWGISRGACTFWVSQADPHPKVFPYLAYFDKFIYKDWECPQRSFSAPRRFAVCYPF